MNPKTYQFATMSNSYRTCILQYQEEERRIALVMARKEEEKKKEMNKMSVMKVKLVFEYLALCFDIMLLI